MLLMYYPSIRGEYFTDYAKKFTWNLLNPYIDSHSQRLIDEYPGDGVQAIKRFKYQCTNMTFSDQSRFNILFQTAIHRGDYSAINYIKIFQNDKFLEVSVGNNYSKDHLMHTLLEISGKAENTLLR